MFQIDFDPEETKRQQESMRMRDVARLESTLQAGFRQYMIRHIVIAIICAGAFYVSSHHFFFPFIITVTGFTLYWFELKRTLKKLKADPSATYVSIVLPKGSGKRIFILLLIACAIIGGAIIAKLYGRA